MKAAIIIRFIVWLDINNNKAVFFDRFVIVCMGVFIEDKSNQGRSAMDVLFIYKKSGGNAMYNDSS